MSGRTILYENARGYITIEQTGKSRSYIVWKHVGTHAVKDGTYGLGLSNAFDRAKQRLNP